MSIDSGSPAHNSLPLQTCTCSSATIRVLEHPPRRAIVLELLQQGAVEIAELTSVLESTGEDSNSQSRDSHQKKEISIRQVHVPKLESAGLVSVNRAQDVVELGSHPDVSGGPLITHLLESVDQAVWEAAAAVHRNPRRGAVLAVLAQSGPAHIGYVASKLAESAEHFADGSETESTDNRTDIEIALHHVHLPVLDDVGLVNYDVDTGQVTYTGDEWFELSDFVETLPPKMRSTL